ncbi:MAG: hypothetical protein H7329_01105 [Opitutaceae bacterium]|nr:hypothetical protein [Cytophagales bacterium]
MKFWQLLDIFRDEKNIIEDEFKKEEWKHYFGLYKNLESIIRCQKRDVLDMKIDYLLLKNICSNSKKKIYFSTSKKIIYSYQNLDTDQEIVILKAIDLFNHDAIEEVFEKTFSQLK